MSFVRSLASFIFGMHLGHRTAQRKSKVEDLPIPMLLWCPKCNERHIDEGDFASKPHRDHSCQFCGMTWRPSTQPTVGVQFLPGYKNETAPPDVPSFSADLYTLHATLLASDDMLDKRAQRIYEAAKTWPEEGTSSDDSTAWHLETEEIQQLASSVVRIFEDTSAQTALGRLFREQDPPMTENEETFDRIDASHAADRRIDELEERCAEAEAKRLEIFDMLLWTRNERDYYASGEFRRVIQAIQSGAPVDTSTEAKLWAYVHRPPSDKPWAIRDNFDGEGKRLPQTSCAEILNWDNRKPSELPYEKTK